jgi:hypothetical protein
LIAEAGVDLVSWESGGKFGCDAEVASKCRRGEIGLWKHKWMVFGFEDPKAQQEKSERGGSKPYAS